MLSLHGPGTCLYECRVMHRRLSPKAHQFSYNIFLFSLDLDETDATAARVRGFSHNRWNLYNFRDRDHLTLPGLEQATIKENILTWIRSQPDPPACNLASISSFEPKTLTCTAAPVSAAKASKLAGSW